MVSGFRWIQRKSFLNHFGEISRQLDYLGKCDQNEIDGGCDADIIIKDKVSAEYIGETSIRRTHINLETNPRPPEIINFILPLKFRTFLTLESYFKLTLEDEGWEEKIFEVYMVEKDENKNIMKLTGYEVQT